MSKKFIPFGRPAIGREEIRAVTEVLRSGWIGMGPKCLEFEKAFAEYVGAPYAVSVSSCTAALHLSLVALGIGRGDEVITTPLTFVATVNAIEETGAHAVLADIDPRTLNISPKCVESAIGSRTKAIMPVHFGGLSCEMSALSKIAKKHNLFLIEDAAHAAGSGYHGRRIGGLPGSLACFSFYPNKNMTTVEGGMITLESDELAKNLNVMRLHGLDNEAWKRYRAGAKLTFSEVVSRGFKYNLTDMQAAIGLCQLRRLEEFIATKERYAAIYDEHFQDLPVLRQPRGTKDGERHSLHLYVLVVRPERFAVSRDELVSEIRALGIGATVHYKAVHLHPYFFGWLAGNGSVKNSEYASDNIFTVPLSPSMSEREALRVAKTVRKVLKAHLR